MGSNDGLAAQHAVFGERKPHQLQLVFLDRLLDRLGFPRLIFVSAVGAQQKLTGLGRAAGIRQRQMPIGPAFRFLASLVRCR